MKKSILVAMIALGLGNFAFAQKANNNANPPAAVLQAFQKQYPGIKAKWEKEKGNYEAGFHQGKKEMSAVYEANGALLETEVEIAASELPSGVTKYASAHNLGKVKEAAKITKANGTVEYEAEVKGGDAIFDAKGNFLRMSKD